MGVLLLSLFGLAACRESREEPSATALTYRSGLPLHARATDGGREGDLRLEQITYTSADGERVPALLAVPTALEPLGCVVYQGGFGQAKEQLPDLRRRTAEQRLATFTIDPRNAGARGSLDEALTALEDPEALRDMVHNTVVDLRMGLDYLERRPECHGNIAYVGTSFGAVVGALVAAQDPRIKAVALTSIGPTFKSGILVSNVAAQEMPDVPVLVPGAGTDPEILARAVSILAPYDPVRWVGRIAPRPLLLVNGRFDPTVLPIDALELADSARDPKTVLYFDGGHDPFAPGPDEKTVALRLAEFLADSLGVPAPA